jgi:hypothetical protein
MVWVTLLVLVLVLDDAPPAILLVFAFVFVPHKTGDDRYLNEDGGERRCTSSIII